MNTGNEGLTTTSMLLERLMDEGEQSIWHAFDERYRPVLFSVATRLGLSPADGDEVAQQTLTEFLRDYRAGKYDRDRGRLRAWLVGIARHRALDMLRTRAANRNLRGDSVLAQFPDDSSLTRIWDEECERECVRQALGELARTSRLSRVTLDAFEGLVLQEEAPDAVAARLGVSIHTVYHAKHRCMAKLRGILEKTRDAFELG